MTDTERGRSTADGVVWWSRRALLAGVVVWAVWVLLGDHVPAVCHDVVAGTSVVRVCEPMTATDPRALMFLLVIILLLFPELSEMELAGVLTLKRRLDEAKAEVSEVRTELAHIRTQAVATASLQAGLRNEMTVFVGDRQRLVGEAVSEVLGGGDGDFDAEETLGAYAQFAFEAGLAGLIALMPAWASNCLLLGYTLTEKGVLELSYFTGNSESKVLNAAVDKVTPSPTGVGVSQNAECWAVTAPGFDDGGAIVGAVAILVPHEDFPLADGQLGGDEQLQHMAGWGEIVANAYARLLIDILGEEPRQEHAGETTREKGQ